MIALAVVLFIVAFVARVASDDKEQADHYAEKVNP